MPKVQSESANLRLFVEELSSDIFKTDGKILYCIICDQAVSVTKCSGSTAFKYKKA